MNKWFLFLIGILIIENSLFAQEKSKEILRNFSGKDLYEILKKLEDTYEVKFSFSPELIEDKKLDISLKGEGLQEILQEIGFYTGLEFSKINPKYYYITPSKAQELNQVVVQAYLTSGIDKNTDGSYHYKIKNFGLLPGLTDNDILESIQLFPGVANIDESATNFYVRGGLPDQNRQIWDGINIYHNGHLFGLISPFNPNAIDKVSFFYKGTPVEYGERASSVIEMNTYENIPSKTRFEWGINGIYSDLFLHTPIIKDKWSFQFSFRRSYEDFLFETPVFSNYEAKAFQNASIENDYFYFNDYHFKMNIYPAKNHRFFVSFIHIDNDLENTTRLDNLENTDMLDTENTGYSLKWEWKIHRDLSWNNLFSASHYDLHYNNLQKTDLDLKLDYHKKNSIKDFFFSTSFDKTFNQKAQIKTGLQISRKELDYQLTEERDLLLILDEDQSVMDIWGIFVDYRHKNSKNNWYLGLRSNYYSLSGKFKLEPRFVYNRKLNRHLNLQITGEIKNQVISQLRTSIYNSFTLEDKIWHLSDDQKYPVITSYHFTTGSIYKNRGWLLDFDVYFKKLDGISSYSLGILNPLDNRLYTGEQKTLGFDIFIKKRFKKFDSRLSYTFSDIQNRFPGFNDSKFFRASSDIRHSLNLGFSYHYKKFEWALGWLYRYGKPSSELEFEEEDDEDEYEESGLLEDINEYRLPNYNRLDFSSSYKFFLDKKKKIKAKAGLSIRNLLNNKIIINQEFIGNSTLDDDVRILNYYSLKFTPNFMFRIYW